MKTTINDLLFKTQDQAQAILDVQDPGYEVAVTRSGYTVVFDHNRKSVLTFAHSYNQKP